MKFILDPVSCNALARIGCVLLFKMFIWAVTNRSWFWGAFGDMSRASVACPTVVSSHLFLDRCSLADPCDSIELGRDERVLWCWRDLRFGSVVRFEQWVERGVGDPFGDRPLLDRPFDEWLLEDRSLDDRLLDGRLLKGRLLGDLLLDDRSLKDRSLDELLQDDREFTTLPLTWISCLWRRVWCRRRHIRHDPAEHWVMVCPLPRQFVHNEASFISATRVFAGLALKNWQFFMSWGPRHIWHVHVPFAVVKVYPRDELCRYLECWSDDSFVSFDLVLGWSPFARAVRKSTRCVYEGILLSGNVWCHLRIVDEDNLDVNKSIKMTFDVTGSPNFSNALRFNFTVSRKSSMASGVSFDILG
jgi:hypothetical protein